MDKLHIVTVMKAYRVPNDQRIILDVLNCPPKGLESPDLNGPCSEALLIHTDGYYPNNWVGCDAFWDNECWLIKFAFSAGPDLDCHCEAMVSLVKPQISEV
jgi:hypothetical protein